MKLVLLAVGLLAARANAGEFPIGLYGVSASDPLETIAEAGFTHVLPGAKGANDQVSLARASRRRGLSVIGVPQSMMNTPSGAFKASAWYLSDEPDVNNESPEQIRRQAAEVRAWDPRTPLVLVVGAGARAAEYAGAVDAVMVDWYPVPHLPLTSVGEEIGTAVSQVTEKPVWAVLQAMDWRDYPQRDPNKPRIGRFPSRLELRFMAYHAVVRGATGVFFFKFARHGQPGSTLLDRPEHWEAVRSVTRELRALVPFFEAGRGERLTLAGLEAMRWRRWRWGRDLVVLLNSTAAPQPLPAQFKARRYRCLFEAKLSPDELLPSGLLLPHQALILLSR